MSKEIDKIKVTCKFFCDGQMSNRKKMFKESLLLAKTGKVLYILKEELNEIPELSQDINIINQYYLKMISFLYVSTLEALIETLSTLPDWQNVPLTIMLEDLGEYCDKNDKHNACGLIAFLIDTASSCSRHLKTQCNLFISINGDVVGEDYCNLMQELYEINSVK